MPFEHPSIPDRRFFHNAGRTERRGVELGLGVTAGPVDLGLSYQYAHFRYEEYATETDDYSGNRIPGVPRQQLQGSATVRRGPLWLTLEGIASGSVVVDDANTTSAPGYEVLHVRAGGSAIFGRPWLSPVTDTASSRWSEP